MIEALHRRVERSELLRGEQARAFKAMDAYNQEVERRNFDLDAFTARNERWLADKDEARRHFLEFDAEVYDQTKRICLGMLDSHNMSAESVAGALGFWLGKMIGDRDFRNGQVSGMVRWFTGDRVLGSEGREDYSRRTMGDKERGAVNRLKDFLSRHSDKAALTPTGGARLYGRISSEIRAENDEIRRDLSQACERYRVDTLVTCDEGTRIIDEMRDEARTVKADEVLGGISEDESFVVEGSAPERIRMYDVLCDDILSTGHDYTIDKNGVSLASSDESYGGNGTLSGSYAYLDMPERDVRKAFSDMRGLRDRASRAQANLDVTSSLQALFQSRGEAGDIGRAAVRDDLASHLRGGTSANGIDFPRFDEFKRATLDGLMPGTRLKSSTDAILGRYGNARDALLDTIDRSNALKAMTDEEMSALMEDIDAAADERSLYHMLCTDDRLRDFVDGYGGGRSVSDVRDRALDEAEAHDPDFSKEADRERWDDMLRTYGNFSEAFSESMRTELEKAWTQRHEQTDCVREVVDALGDEKRRLRVSNDLDKASERFQRDLDECAANMRDAIRDGLGGAEYRDGEDVPDVDALERLVTDDRKRFAERTHDLVVACGLEAPVKEILGMDPAEHEGSLSDAVGKLDDRLDGVLDDLKTMFGEASALTHGGMLSTEEGASLIDVSRALSPRDMRLYQSLFEGDGEASPAETTLHELVVEAERSERELAGARESVDARLADLRERANRAMQDFMRRLEYDGVDPSDVRMIWLNTVMARGREDASVMCEYAELAPSESSEGRRAMTRATSIGEDGFAHVTGALVDDNGDHVNGAFLTPNVCSSSDDRTRFSIDTSYAEQLRLFAREIETASQRRVRAGNPPFGAEEKARYVREVVDDVVRYRNEFADWVREGDADKARPVPSDRLAMWSRRSEAVADLVATACADARDRPEDALPDDERYAAHRVDFTTEYFDEHVVSAARNKLAQERAGRDFSWFPESVSTRVAETGPGRRMPDEPWAGDDGYDRDVPTEGGRSY